MSTAISIVPSRDVVLKLLNRLLELDREAITALCDARVPVNEALSTATDIELQDVVVGDRDGKVTLGMIGVLQGLCGTKRICAVYGPDGLISRFEPWQAPEEQPT